MLLVQEHNRVLVDLLFLLNYSLSSVIYYTYCSQLVVANFVTYNKEALGIIGADWMSFMLLNQQF